jgi:MFS family permease
MPKDGGEEFHYGTAFGLLNVFWSLGYALGPLVGGAITGAAGLLAALLTYSGVLVLLAVIVMVFLKEGERAPDKE